MQFSLNRDQLNDALKTLSRVAKTGNAPLFGVFGTILIDAHDQVVTLAAFNGETTLRIELPAQRTKKQGAICVPAATLTELVKRLPTESIIGFTLNTKTLVLTLDCEANKTDLKQCLDAKEFPHIPDFQSDSFIEMDAVTLKGMISRTLFSVAQEDNRPVLTGVLMEFDDQGMKLVSTDGYRVSWDSYSTIGSLQAIVPGFALGMVAAAIKADSNILIALNGEKVAFLMDSYQLVTTSVYGSYPNYAAVFPPTYAITVNVEREPLLNALKLAEPFAIDSANKVTLTFRYQQIAVSAASQEKGSGDSIVSAYLTPADPLEISFNVRYLIEALSTIENECVALCINAANAPMLIDSVSVEGTYKHVIMPMSMGK